MRTIYLGARDSFELKNVDVSGFLIRVRATGNAVNTDPVDVPYKPTLNVKLKQGNFNGTIVDGSILGLAKGTAKKFEKWVESDAHGLRTITAKSGSAKGVLEWLYKIELPSIINLNDEDVMTVDVYFPGDSLTTCESAYLTIKEITGIGNQAVVPKIFEYILPELDTRYDKDLGSNITRIVFVGSAGKTPAEDGLTQIDMKSDRRDYVMDGEEIVYEGVTTESKAVIALNKNQNDVRIKCTMDGVLNASGDLRMIVCDFWSDSSTIATAVRRERWQKQSLVNDLV